jgi:hypothetical protein
MLKYNLYTTPSISMNKAPSSSVFFLDQEFLHIYKDYLYKISIIWKCFFKYESNDSNYIQYNQDLVARFFGKSSSWNTHASYSLKRR